MWNELEMTITILRTLPTESIMAARESMKLHGRVYRDNPAYEFLLRSGLIRKIGEPVNREILWESLDQVFGNPRLAERRYQGQPHRIETSPPQLIDIPNLDGFGMELADRARDENDYYQWD